MLLRQISDDQLAEIISRVSSGETTLTDEARAHGLSRERVRQLVHERTSSAVSMGKAVRAQRVKERRLQKRKRSEHEFSCRVCGRKFMASMAGNWPAATCGPLCRDAWRSARYQLDPERRWSHTVAMARWHIKHAGAEKQVPSELAWAKRVLEAHAKGEKIGAGTRYINSQSKGYALIVKALGSTELADRRIKEGYLPRA